MTTAPAPDDALGGRRRWWGYLLAVGLPAVLTVGLVPVRGQVDLASDLLLFLLANVVVALVGGWGPALLSAVVGFVLINYWFVIPLHTLSVKDPNNTLALVVFVLVAVLVSSAVEVAARRTAEAARVAREKDFLTQVDRTRTALLAAVGHDLRTPLSAAKASVSTLRSAELVLSDEDRADLVQNAEESLDRLAGLIENLLDLSRLQAGAMAVTNRPVALEEVVARALDDLGPQARGVVVELPHDLPEALADPGLLERVLVNVLANALRHSPADRPPRLVADAIGAPAGGADPVGGPRVELRVVDHGPGIPHDERDRVFAPFQRLGDRDNATGVGLGLALSRGLTEAMGGTLEPVDTPGGGLTMRVRLPRGDAPASVLRPGLRERGLLDPAPGPAPDHVPPEPPGASS